MSARPPAIDCASSLLQGVFEIRTHATVEGGSKKRHFYTYKPLLTRFRRGEFDYRQVPRERDAAIYQQTWNGYSDPSVCYEVVRIRRREGFQIDGRLVEPAEVYPSSQARGLEGWTVRDKESAFRKLRELILQKESANLLKKSPTQNSERCSESIKLRGDVKNSCDG